MWGGGVDDAESAATIEAALDAGINMIDTAEGYGGGHSEEVIGKVLEGRRDKMMIATKVWKANLTKDGIGASLEASLKRLRTDYIDLYQVHWPNDDIPIEETMSTLEEYRRQGKIRWIGVSNFSVKQMTDAMKVARFESLQPPYNLYWRYVEGGELAWCVENGVSVIPYSPMAQGLLAGKFTADHTFTGDDIRAKGYLFQDEVFKVAIDGIEKMKPIAEALGCTMPQLTLAWLLTRPRRRSAHRRCPQTFAARRAARCREREALRGADRHDDGTGRRGDGHARRRTGDDVGVGSIAQRE